jgi:hypothetical protein
VIEQGLARALIGTVEDAKLVANLIANGAKVGDAVDVEVGGLVDEGRVCRRGFRAELSGSFRHLSA